ncbi:hypothetical protein ABIB59_001513 [Citrobacter sp. UYEF32]|jgi:hypothetical protein
MLVHMVRYEEATLDLVLIQHILLIMQFQMLPAPTTYSRGITINLRKDLHELIRPNKKLWKRLET